VRDLTGADSALAQALPPDEESLGFSNSAEAYSISTLHATKYLEVAERIASHLIADGPRLEAFATCDPTSESSCVERFIRAFGLRAYRRPLSEGEVSALAGLHRKASAVDAAEGVRAVVVAMLQAPQFLYRLEPSPSDGEGGAPLEPYALATRLSYLVTASAPDAELLESAADGSLATRQGLAEQAERLLETPHALETFTEFVRQWWELGQLSAIEKDRRLYRNWDPELPALFDAELRHFLAEAWSAGPSLETLLRAPYTFVNPRLAAFYGVRSPASDGFSRVELDPRRAAGILTQGALLATHAKADQTSPVHRGKFVRARLFCTIPPPPPDDLVVRPPAVDPRLSTRERFAEHTGDGDCAACHRLMDPIGFGFEHYDATGRYREVDGGKPVDASGELTGTDVDGAFVGVPELAERLVESEQVRRCVATQWFRYAFGRGDSTVTDSCTIAELASELGANGGDLRALFSATVNSELFRAGPEVTP
jgi:hypothetical protein